MQSYGPTKANETLWSIASRHHPAKVTVEQTALAIVKLNPKSFQGSDYVLRLHSYLRLPTTASEVKSVLGLTAVSTANSKAKASSKLNKPVVKSARTVSSAKSVHPHKLPSADHRAVSPQPMPPQQAYLSQIAELNQQLTAANQQIASLQQQLSDSNSNVNGFPWASLWFILWALTSVSLYMVYRRYKSAETVETEDDANLKAQLKEARGKTEPIIISVSEKEPENPFQQGELDIPANEIGLNEQSLAETTDNETEQAEDMPATPEIQALLQQIETDPYNLELRMELLELYANASDQAGFNQQSREMLNHNLMMEGDEVWSKVRALYLNTWVYA
jgi:FimV-like protein